MTLDPIPLSAPGRMSADLRGRIAAAVDAVVDSGWWLKGEQTERFQDEFAAYCGTQYCLGVANGTDGLELALRAAGASGRKVITVANAGGYTTSACRLVGAIPSYVDIDPSRLTMDLDAVGRALTPETCAVVVTHLYGNAVDVAMLCKMLAEAGRSDVAIIEDASQAHGARIGDARVGSLGELGVFSFYPTKNLGALGDAGAVVCRDGALFDRLKALHQYGWTERYFSSEPFGRNSRIDEIQAAALRVKLPLLAGWNQERRRIAGAYAAALGDGKVSVVNDLDGDSVVHLVVVRSPNRQALQRHLSTLGIQWGVHFPVLDCDQVSQHELPYESSDLGESRSALREIVTVPCFPGMTDGEVERVSAALSSFVSGAARV